MDAPLTCVSPACAPVSSASAPADRSGLAPERESSTISPPTPSGALCPCRFGTRHSSPPDRVPIPSARPLNRSTRSDPWDVPYVVPSAGGDGSDSAPHGVRSLPGGRVELAAQVGDPFGGVGFGCFDQLAGGGQLRGCGGQLGAHPQELGLLTFPSLADGAQFPA